MSEVKNNIEQSLISGGVGVIPTDTLYGLVARAEDAAAVLRVYQIKNRDKSKACIILISKLEDLEHFRISFDAQTQEYLKSVWPGPVSVILPCRENQFEYLHRGTNELAFRLPKNDRLISIITSVGPLIVPSANTEGLPPAKNISEARNYFGDNVDFYLDGGELLGEPSALIWLKGNEPEVLRSGGVFRKKLFSVTMKI